MNKHEAEARISNVITGHFEGGKPSSLNTIDKGIVSYGKHQATLASGLLERVLNEYTTHSTAQTASDLHEFSARVHAKDPALRNDSAFLGLLKTAGGDPAMSRAQDYVFEHQVRQPALNRADRAGMNSPLGHVIAFDTAVQHGQRGLEHLLQNTTRALHGGVGETIDGIEITEARFAEEFLHQRQVALREIAERQKTSHDPATRRNGAMLEAAAQNRIEPLQTLVRSGDFALDGDKDGFVRLPGTSVKVPGMALQMTGRSAPQIADNTPHYGTAPLDAHPANVHNLRSLDASGFVESNAIEQDRNGDPVRVLTFEKSATAPLRIPSTDPLFVATEQAAPHHHVHLKVDPNGGCIVTNSTQGIRTTVSRDGIAASECFDPTISPALSR